MVRYSLALLSVATAAVLFSGCGEGGCCATPSPTAVIAGLKAGEVITRENFTLSGIESHDNNSNGRVVDYLWTVNGTEVASGYTLPVGTHDVCLTVTDNDSLTDKTCGKVTITATANQAPTAIITPALPTSCTAGDVLNVSGATSSDTDGNIASYAWTPASIGAGASGTVTCPTSGSFQVCLTVADNDGATDRRCSGNITVAESTLKKPTAIIAEDTTQGDNGCDLTAGAPYIDNKAKYLSCGTSFDNDNIDPTPDKGRTDTNIVKCVWNVSVYEAGVENPHVETYVTFLTDGGVDIANSMPGTLDPKWMGHEGDYKIITLTVFDDDDQNDTVTKKLDYSIGACGGLVDP